MSSSIGASAPLPSLGAMVFVATMLVNATAANGVRWAFRSGSDLPLADRLAPRGDITHLPGAEDAVAVAVAVGLLGATYQTLFPPYLPTPGTTSSAAATAPN